MGKRRRRSGGARCRTCGHQILFMAHPRTGAWVPFEPTPVNGRAHIGGDAYPGEGKRTYLVRDLVEVLMERHDYSRGEAETETYDMPWFVLHRCRTTSTTSTEAQLDLEGAQ